MTLYEALKMFAEDEYNGRNPVEECHTSSYNMKLSEKNEYDPSRTIVFLNFDREEYLKMIQEEKTRNHTNNDYYINIATGSGYHSNVFIDSYSSEEDFVEGYIIRYFSENNIEKLKDILRMINPKLLQEFIDGNADKEVSEFLMNRYESQSSSIAYEYSEYHDACLVAGMKEYLFGKGCNILTKFKIVELKCQRKYVTTVGNIVGLYEKYGHTDSDILEFLHKIINDENLYDDDDYGDDYYAFYDDNNFDDKGFNSWVEKQLDKIIESIEEDKESGDLEKERELYELMEKLNIRFEKWNDFPKEKGRPGHKFAVKGFDNGKIVVQYSNNSPNRTGGAMQTYKMGFEDFLNFLYHPELFD